MDRLAGSLAVGLTWIYLILGVIGLVAVLVAWRRVPAVDVTIDWS